MLYNSGLGYFLNYFMNSLIAEQSSQFLVLIVVLFIKLNSFP
jgi:hypothetical protein